MLVSRKILSKTGRLSRPGKDQKLSGRFNGEEKGEPEVADQHTLNIALTLKWTRPTKKFKTQDLNIFIN